ncbi:MAG: carboxypeptidase-like regulatory domain-containing protein [Thermoplasmatota archaeon]
MIVLLSVALAGCAEEAGTGTGPDDGDPGSVAATDTTGGIRGVVVDQAIVPIVGADITIASTGEATQTDDNGNFVISGLDPGTYFLTVSHPLYDVVQQSVDVEAGVETPAPVKIQLTRVILDDPYASTTAYKGFIFCSMNVVGAYAEECGEGLGYPCNVPETVFGCGDRIGKNDNNRPGQEWFVDSSFARSMAVEQIWDPSLEVSASGGGQFRTFVSINWVCDPFCGDDHRFGVAIMNSPLHFMVTQEMLEAVEFDTETRFTSFTYAADNPGVILEQNYDQFVTVSYGLPLPEGWSYINGDANPFA